MILDVAQLEDDFLSLYFTRRPYQAGQLGCRWGRGLTPPVGPETTADLLTAFDQLAGRLAQVRDVGSHTERLTTDLISELCGYERESLQANWSRFTVSPLPEAGLASQTLIFLPYATVRTEQDQQLFLASCAGVEALLATAGADLALGRADGRVPVAGLVERSIDQIRSYLATPLAADPYLSVLRSARAAPALISELGRLVAEHIRPAFARYMDDLSNAVMPTARSDARPGIGWLPDGPRLYASAAREHTTLPVDPSHLHQVGLDLVRDLHVQASVIGRELGWDAHFPLIRDRLRHDRTLHFRDAQQIVTAARAAKGRAEAIVSRWITDPPEASCEIREMGELESAHGVLGHYETAPLDRSGPGVYWVNTSNPTSRPAYEAEALAFHESVPGHHLEIATTQERGETSTLRSLVNIMPYSEGWALYMERFADEIGLYSDDVSRLGMVSFGLWRASRLVVDTGIHEFGWSRRQAMEYLWSNTILTRGNIANEVDRYIAHPGSALAYMVGRLAIQQLRDSTVASVTSPAEVRRFHDGLIRRGPLTMSLLSAEMGIELRI